MLRFHSDLRIKQVLQCFSLIGALLLATSSPSAADVAEATGDCGAGTVQVRGKKTFRNNTGKTASDFHIYMYQNDRPKVVVLGASVDVTGAFTNATIELDSDNDRPNPPPGDHGAKVNLNGGSVAPGESITIEFTLCMNQRNVLKLKDKMWTFPADPPDDDNQGRPKKKGWRVKRPHAGGSGGNPGDPSGGGQGAQEDDGGTGNYIHTVCIENDDENESILLEELKLLASMTLYADPENGIDWNSIAPIQNSEVPPEPPVIIPPRSAWCYAFETTGSYVGGHVYLKFKTSVVSQFAMSRGGDDPELEDIGDHPVDEECSDPGCATFPPPSLGACCDFDTNTCVDDVFEHDCDSPSEVWTAGATCAEVCTFGCCWRKEEGSFPCVSPVLQVDCDETEGWTWVPQKECGSVECGPEPVPAVSQLGVFLLIALILAAAMVVINRRQATVTA